MSGAITQYGGQGMLNWMTGAVVPFYGSSAPSWFPGLYWINSSDSNQLYDWNGAAWVRASTLGRWLALLTGDPQQSGANNNPAVSIADLQEVITTGYSRIAVSFSAATGTFTPANATNSNLLTWGPMTANMQLPAQWAALVTCSSGTNGLLYATWALDTPEQVSASQVIQIASGELLGSLQ